MDLNALERKMTCSVCIELVGKDACQFMCPGQHPICFSCVVQYCESLGTEYINLKCPTCKTGDGSFFFSSMLADLSPKKDDVPLKDAFLDQFDQLKEDNPTYFQSRTYIRPIEILIFRRLSTTRPVRQTWRALPSGEARKWVSVCLNDTNETILLSLHDSEALASHAARHSSGRYTITFITEVRGEGVDRCVVVKQERPVHINILLPFMWYIENTYNFSQTYISEIKSMFENCIDI